MKSLRGLIAGKSASRLAGLALLAMLLGLRWADPVLLSNLRNQTFDVYQRIKTRPYTPAPIIIADIDEESLRRFGQWPWPRTRMADLVDRLREAGAVAVGFDMVFAEPDRLSPVRIAQDNPGLPQDARNALAVMASNETVFAAAIGRAAVVLGETAARTAPSIREEVPEMPSAAIGQDPRPFILRYSSLVQNLPVLAEAAKGKGVFTVEPDPDGVFRRVPIVVSVEDRLRLALSAELLRVATGGHTFATVTDGAGVNSVRVGGNAVPTDPEGKVWPWFSRSDQRRYVSAGDVLGGSAKPEAVAGKLVLVGTSAVGLEDYRATPVEAAMPGVEIHAQIIENILGGTMLFRPNYALGMELTYVLVAGLLIVWLVPSLGAVWASAAAILLIGGSAALSWFAYDQQRLLIDPTFPAGASLALFIAMATANYAREEAQKRQIRGAFGQYLSPALVEQLSRNPDLLKLGGETKDLTVLFTDVRGFTGISEAYKANPQGLTRLMNRFLTVMSRPILEEAGTIDKYMGDAIMAFWNAPLAEERHALRACRAALAMIANVAALNAQRRAELEGNADEPYKEINVGIGINSGTAVVGNMGSDMRFDYTALGDTVNIASRLEGQSKPFGISIIMGSKTAEAVRDVMALMEIDLIRVKGKAEPERIFALLGDEAILARDEFLALRAMNMTMIGAYRRQEWDAANEACDQMQLLGERLGLDLADYLFVYESRIAEYRNNPPGPNWDAVYVATEK